MSACEHKTESEYNLCTKCSVFKRIAKGAKALLDARQKYISALLVPGEDSDGAQEDLQDKIKRLEQDVQLADNGNLWD